ncbi:MAG: hypothetical protein C5B51_13410 [Terriglobia bacterium]|nr:MAG: hypothetical protein C5B51_13410 [Terriglobia bacterium]
MSYSIFTGIALKSLILPAVAWLVVVILRHSSAAARHVVWMAAFAALLALPPLMLWLPALRMPMPAPALIAQSIAAVPDAVTPMRAPLVAATRAASHSALPGGRPAWLLLWAAGALLALSQTLVGWLVMCRLRRNGPRFPSAVAGGPVEILQGPRGSMPLAFGLLRPVVFLPADASEWSDERRRLVLAHELAHIRRGDIALHLLARIALSFYWWNPLAWAAWRGLLKERERAADDLVLSAGARPADYAGHLLEIARSFHAAPAAGWAALAMARKSQLEGRLLAILDSRANRNAPGRAWALAASLTAILLVCPFAAIQAQDGTETLPADVDATIRAAAAQHNHQMLEDAARAAEVLRRYDMAQKLLESSLTIRAQTSGEQSVDYGLGLLKLGDLERSRRNFNEAEAFYTKAASVLGTRPEGAAALVDLGTAALRRKDPAQAADYFRRAQLADPARPGTALMWLAVVSDQQGNVQEADSFFKHALTVQDPNSGEAATTAELYVSFLQRQSRAEEAESVRGLGASARKAQAASAVTVRESIHTPAFRAGDGVTAPVVLSKVQPQYSDEAKLAKYQGTVAVAVEIGTDGSPQSMKVIRGLGLGLEEQAMKAIGQWKFQPGTKGGQPVPVIATIEVNFRLL